MTQSVSGLLTPSRGKVTAVLGPTNTGKTHYAIERMMGHESGMIGLPLRLLAREVYDRVCEQKPAAQVALLTGEEKILPEGARYFVCTVESMPMDRETAFLAVDEIQLCADPERGHVFTDRLLHARGTQETLFLGAETMRGIIRTLMPDTTFLSRNRFSELTHAGSRKLSKLQRRSAVVAFSTENVYGLAELVRRLRGGAAVVMGALSPRTRNAQVELYQSGDVDYLIATDAIGMGLNMDVDHVALASLRKYDGSNVRPLRAHEIGQIAGRAGRYRTDGTFGTTGDASDIDGDMVEQIENHRFDPVRMIGWRNRDLDFSSIDALIESLEVAPPVKGLMRTRNATDQAALVTMREDSDIAGSVSGQEDLERLWRVCQIPDFRNITTEEHVRLLSSVYRHLIENNGRLPEDWLKGHVDRLDETQGDIDTLASRIANIRTWTFVSNRADWLEDAPHWQERTRAVEDKLSDALHEALTQRFVDRRTSVLMKSLHLKEDLMSEISAEGEVTVEGHYVGRLSGFRFVPDPRANGADGKALRAAATKALKAMIGARAQQLVGAHDGTIELSEHGRLRWNGEPVAKLSAGSDAVSPRLELLADAQLEGSEREAVEARLNKWLSAHLTKLIQPLLDLKEAAASKTNGAGGDDAASAAEMIGGVAPLSGLARGIGYQLVENFGVLDRRKVADQMRDLDQDGRAQLRRFGVRFGQYSIFLPALLKPAPARLLVTLWAAQNDSFPAQEDDADNPPPAPPPPGLCSVALDPGSPEAFYAAAGFRVCGARAVRVDMLERLGDMIRSARTGEAPAKGKKSPPKPEAPQTEKPADMVQEEAAPAAGDALASAQAENPAEQAGQAPDAEPAAETPSSDGEVVQEAGTDKPAEAAEAPEQPAEAATQEGPEAEAKPEEAPVEAPSSEGKPAPELPSGAFLVSADMMSIVGCSGDDFAEILRSLGYRQQTLPPVEGAEDSEPVIAWRYQVKRDRAPGRPHREVNRNQRTHGGQKAGEGRGPRKKGKGGKPGPARDGQRKGPGGPKNYGNKGGRRPERKMDPDSPFAVLAALKEDNKG